MQVAGHVDGGNGERDSSGVMWKGGEVQATAPNTVERSSGVQRERERNFKRGRERVEREGREEMKCGCPSGATTAAR